MGMAQSLSFRKATHYHSETVNEIFKPCDKCVSAGWCKSSKGWHLPLFATNIKNTRQTCTLALRALKGHAVHTYEHDRKRLALICCPVMCPSTSFIWSTFPF